MHGFRRRTCCDSSNFIIIIYQFCSIFWLSSCAFPGTQPQIRELEEQFLERIFTPSFQPRDTAAEDKENDAQENDKAIPSVKQGESAKRAPQDKVITPAKRAPQDKVVAPAKRAPQDKVVAPAQQDKVIAPAKKAQQNKVIPPAKKAQQDKN